MPTTLQFFRSYLVAAGLFILAALAPRVGLAGDPPSVTTQPTNLVVLLGGTATFTAAGQGADPLFYQWQVNGTNLVNSGRVSGATASMLTISTAQMSDLGSYRLVLSNTDGTAISAEASLSVVPIVAWGADWQGQTDVPTTLTNALTLAAGGLHNLVLTSDGNIVGWGFNADGQATAPPGLSNVVTIAAGAYHSFALESDGTLVGWGKNNVGQATVPAGLSNVVAVSGGANFSLALRNDGKVFAWGYNDWNQTYVPGNLSNVVAIAAGYYHAVALKNDGTVVCWGSNPYGESSPPPDLSNVVAVAAGDYHSLALRNDGTVVGWGWNGSGQATPPPDLSNVTAIGAGASYSVALKNDGTVAAWGTGAYGQTNPPTWLVGVADIAVGYYSAAALVANPATQVPPVIWQQPADVTLPTGSTAVFNLGVTGSQPLNFQWRFNGVPLAGATNRWLALTSIQPEQVGNYQVVVANDSGSVTSRVAVLSETPAILVQPTNLTVFQGSNATFSASAIGPEPLSYQWQVKGPPFPNSWVVLGDATNATLTLTNVQGVSSGSNFRVVVSNPAGSAISSVATLTVLTPPSFTSQPQSQTAVLSSNVTFSATATGAAPIDFQWLFNGTPVTNSDRIQTFNVHNSTYTWMTISNLQTNDAGSYSLVASNLVGTSNSSVATLTVVVPPSVTQGPTNQTTTVGSSVVFSVTAAGSEPLAYQWRANGANLLDAGRITGSKSAALSIAGARLADAADYSVVVSNFAGSVTSAPAALTVYGVEITGQPASQIVRLSSNATFTVAANGQAPLGYQWYFNRSALSDNGRISGSTASSLTLSGAQLSDGGDYWVVVTNPWLSVTSTLATLRLQAVNPAAVLYVDAQGTNPCSPYLDWSTAATNLQDAVDSATDGNQILVAGGVYNSGGAVVYGSESNRVALTKAVILSSVAGPQSSIIVGGTRMRGVYVGSNAVLNGFTITNGHASLNGDAIKEVSGGGIWCETGGIVTNCLIRSNSAPSTYYLSPGTGGGIYGGTVYNSTIEGNLAYLGGGARGSTLWNCAVNRNQNNDSASSSAGGGGVYLCALFNCSVSSNSTSISSYGSGAGALRCILSNCVISGNTALYSSTGGGTCQGTNYNCLLVGNNADGNFGGGTYNSTNLNCVLGGNGAGSGGGTAGGLNRNCLILTNSAMYGGGVYQGTHYNCTIVNNLATNTAPTYVGTGGGAYGGTFYNSIIYFNSASAGSNYSSSILNSSCTAPGGQVTSDPSFVNPLAGNFRLQTNSPCINQGNNFYVATSTDLDGRPRIVSGVVDIGAYEFQGAGMGEFIGWLQQYGLSADGSADDADADADGLNNWQEWVAGTNPTNAQSGLRLALQVPAFVPASVTLTWPSVTNRSYALEYATNLGAPPVFSVLQSNITGCPDTTSWTDTNAAGSTPRFYRVRVEH